MKQYGVAAITMVIVGLFLLNSFNNMKRLVEMVQETEPVSQEVSLLTPDAGVMQDYIKGTIIPMEVPYTLPINNLTIMANDLDFLAPDLATFQDNPEFRTLLSLYVENIRLQLEAEAEIVDLPLWKTMMVSNLENIKITEVQDYIDIESYKALLESDTKDIDKFISQERTIIRQGILKYVRMKKGE